MRLFIDNEQNLDANNVYLPETGVIGTGGAITIDSVTVNDDATASTETTGVVDASDGGQIGATSGTFNSPYAGRFFLSVNGSFIVTTPFTTFNTVEEVLDAIDTLMTGNAIYTFSYSGNLWSLTTIANSNTGHTVEIVADSQDILSTGTFSGGGNPSTITLEFDGGGVVSLSGLNGAEITSADTPETLATKLAAAMNLLADFTPNGVTANGASLSINTTAKTNVYNGLAITITESGGGSVTTSGAVAITGGQLPTTPILAPVSKSRKSAFAGNVLNVNGFVGFIGIDEEPVSKALQADFFSLPANKIVVGANSGFGFTVRIDSIADGTHFFVAAFLINGLNQISNTASEHFVLKIARSASLLTVSLLPITGKSIANGWEFGAETVLANDIPYVAGNILMFIYPQNDATLAQLLSGTGTNNITTIRNITAGTALTALKGLLDGNSFTLPHILANTGANAVISLIEGQGL